MGLQDRLPSGVRIPGMLVLSVVALLIAAAFVLGSVSTLLSAITEPSVQSEDADVVSSLLENNRVLARSEEPFTGRSIFYIPKAPQVPRRPAPPTAPPPPRKIPK